MLCLFTIFNDAFLFTLVLSYVLWLLCLAMYWYYVLLELCPFLSRFSAVRFCEWFISRMMKFSPIMYIFKWLCNYAADNKEYHLFLFGFWPMKRFLQKWYFAFDDLACIQGVTFPPKCHPQLLLRDFGKWKRVNGRRIYVTLRRHCHIQKLAEVLDCRAPALIMVSGH